MVRKCQRYQGSDIEFIFLKLRGNLVIFSDLNKLLNENLATACQLQTY